jgi:hypothetical protein
VSLYLNIGVLPAFALSRWGKSLNHCAIIVPNLTHNGTMPMFELGSWLGQRMLSCDFGYNFNNNSKQLGSEIFERIADLFFIVMTTCYRTF